LLKRGAAKGEVVAVGGELDFDLIASMLGVFLSGGVLLTLDRNLPSERQQVMLREAAAKHLLYNGRRRAVDQWLDAVPSLMITETKDIAEAVTEVDLPIPDPDDAAYLFFTSGTSGIPKGVLGCHKGLSHFLKWQRERFEVTPADRSAQFTGLSFDVVLRDIFLPLTSGASLHLPEPETLGSAAQVARWLEREQITIMHTVPSLAQSWLNDLPGAVSLPSLRWTFFAGEPLTDSLVQRWRTCFAGLGNVVNLYGPTETTLAKCFFVVPDQPLFGVQPVGRPLPNTQALILNRRQLCGVGELGEITIRTPFRTLGYVNAVEEQQKRFIRNSFTEDDDDLLYLSGDRGRYLPDGVIEILGRLDDQVKIRGVRVEPDEVNVVISRDPSVAASVVIALRDERGENVLVAYIVPSQKAEFNQRELRAHLEPYLPAAMVPAFFVTLEQMPLTANGKVDRSALPLPDLSFGLKEEFVAPRDETEEVIAGIWTEVLAVDGIGVRHNFFDLGGHSLRAMQVLSRLNSVFKIDLPLAALFTHATVESLAEAVEDHLVAQLESMPEDEAHQLLG
jgi:amino acid adenylation domain-containing protein